MTSFAEHLAEAVAAIRARWAERPETGIILGTGLGGLASLIDVDITLDYAEIPHFPRSSALAHAGKLLCGRLSGVPVVTMQGRCHLYEGYSHDQVALPVFAMNALGARRLIVSNASGGVNPNFQMGDVMVLDSHINLMWGSPLRRFEAAFDEAPERSARSHATPSYCPDMIASALAVARRQNFRAHVGVYVAVTGPNYETRAEYRMFRQIGGDAVGMSTIPEVIAASKRGMRTMALSVITNVAKPDAPENVDAEEVVVAAQLAEANMAKIVQGVLSPAK